MVELSCLAWFFRNFKNLAADAVNMGAGHPALRAGACGARIKREPAWRCSFLLALAAFYTRLADILSHGACVRNFLRVALDRTGAPPKVFPGYADSPTRARKRSGIPPNKMSLIGLPARIREKLGFRGAFRAKSPNVPGCTICERDRFDDERVLDVVSRAR